MYAKFKCIFVMHQYGNEHSTHWHTRFHWIEIDLEMWKKLSKKFKQTSRYYEPLLLSHINFKFDIGHWQCTQKWSEIICLHPLPVFFIHSYQCLQIYSLSTGHYPLPLHFLLLKTFLQKPKQCLFICRSSVSAEF